MRPALSSASSWTSRLGLGLICLVLLAAGCDSQAGSIDIKQTSPGGIEDEIRPLATPVIKKAR